MALHCPSTSSYLFLNYDVKSVENIHPITLCKAPNQSDVKKSTFFNPFLTNV